MEKEGKKGKRKKESEEEKKKGRGKRKKKESGDRIRGEKKEKKGNFSEFFRILMKKNEKNSEKFGVKK